VSRWFRWTGTYYQYANRLATLWFLREQGIGARLVFVSFIADRFPDDTPCPSSEEEWLALIDARRLTLGLPTRPSRRSSTTYSCHLSLLDDEGRPALLFDRPPGLRRGCRRFGRNG
jgi:hypothetical protein